MRSMSSMHQDRNFGCRVHDEYTFRGLKVVVMENELLRISILADKGTDIFELLYKPLDVDFMYSSVHGVRNPNRGLATNVHSLGNLMDYWEGGWFECFPSGAGTANYKGAELGVHGEVHLLPWDYGVVQDTPEQVSVRFWVRTRRTPFLLEKTLTLQSQKPVLVMKEKVTNESDIEMDFMWGHHPVFGEPFLSEDCVLDVPARTGEAHENSTDGSLVPGVKFEWPMAVGKSGRTVDLRKMQPKNAHVEDVVFLQDLDEGWFALTDTVRKLGIGMVWSLDVFPYINLWRNYHGDPDFMSYRRYYCMGVEPFSSIPSLGLLEAVNRGTQLTLKGRESLESELRTMVYTGLSGVKRITPEGQVLAR
jgi:hypothetical protein